LQIDAEESLELTNENSYPDLPHEQEGAAQANSWQTCLEKMDGIWNSIKKKKSTMKSFFIDIYRKRCCCGAFGLFLCGYLLNLYSTVDASVSNLPQLDTSSCRNGAGFERLTRNTAFWPAGTGNIANRVETCRKEIRVFLSADLAVCRGLCNSGRPASLPTSRPVEHGGWNMRSRAGQWPV